MKPKLKIAVPWCSLWGLLFLMVMGPVLKWKWNTVVVPTFGVAPLSFDAACGLMSMVTLVGLAFTWSSWGLSKTVYEIDKTTD